MFVTSRSRDVVIASTHLVPILALLSSRPSLDWDFLATSLLAASGRPTESPFLGIRRVPMGEAWLVRPDREPRRSVTRRPLLQPEVRVDDDERARLLRHEIAAAVRRAIAGTRRVAVGLSGGLDSGSVLALVDQLARTGQYASRPDALSIEYSGSPEWDDAPYRRSLSERLGLSVEEVPPEEGSHMVRRLLVVDARPCRAPLIAAWGALAGRARRRGADLVLSGEGGDDVFNGDAGMFGALARSGSPLRALRTFAGLRGFPGSPLSRLRAGLLFAASPLQPRRFKLLRRRRALHTLYPWARPRLRDYIDGIAAFEASRPRLPLDASPSERYESLLSMRVLADLGAVRAQVEMAGDHVRREPFFDDDLLRFVATVPPLTLFQGGYRRGLMREAMRGLLPEDLRLRQTKAYLEPALVRMVAPLGGLKAFEDLTDVRMLADLGFVEPRRFRAHFDEVAGDPARLGWSRFWAVFAVEAFLRQYDTINASGWS